MAPQPDTEYQTLFGFGPEALDDANVQRDYVSAGNGARTVVWQQQVTGSQHSANLSG